MKLPLKICTIAFCLFASLTAIAAPQPNAKTSPLIEFTATPTQDALRRLAREAQINLVISDKISGTVTMKLRNLTPLKAIQVVCTSKNLIFNEADDVYYVKTQEERNQQINKLDDPEVPVALAKFRKHYYDALIQEGFTKEQAFQLVEAQSVSLREIMPLNVSASSAPERTATKQNDDLLDAILSFFSDN